MREYWAEVAIQDVVQQVRRTVNVEEGGRYPLLGVRWYGNGAFLREVGVGGKIKAAKLYRVEVGDFIYNRLFAWKGSFCVIDETLSENFVSGEFPIFLTDRQRLLPEYLNLFMCQPSTWAQIERESTGSTATSRNRWKEGRFLEWRILLPPLIEQRRIVNLVQTVDAVQDATSHTIEAHSELALRLVDNWVQGWNGPIARLRDIAKMGSGSGWKSSDEVVGSGDGRLRVLGITNTPPGGAITLDQVKYVQGLPKSTPKLSESSLLMIRTNGNRTRIGNVYRIPPKARGCAFSAFQIGLHFGSPDEATFAYWMLSDSQVQSQISLAASGSTGLGNVAITWLRNLEIPWPDSQASKIVISQLFDAAGECVMAGRSLQDTYVELRSCLVSQLLSGSHGITASYDSILEMVS